jgi:hypothetical protein
LVEALQKVIFENRGTLIYPEFRSTSAFIETPENFGFVVLCPEELGNCLKKRLSEINEDTKRSWNLTSDHIYLCQQYGFALPFLPVDTKEEIKLYHLLALSHYEANGDVNFDKMALSWCQYVDGIDIFPKLPVYLRSYYPTMEANLFIKDFSKSFAQQESILSEVMEQTSTLIMDSSSSSSNSSNSSNRNSATTPFFNISQPTPQPNSYLESDSSKLTVVSNIKMDSTSSRDLSTSNKKRGRPRGSISSERVSRQCVFCRDTLKLGMDAAALCDGRIGNKVCPKKLSQTATSNTTATTVHPSTTGTDTNTGI